MKTKRATKSDMYRQEALTRAKTSQSLRNYPEILEGFKAIGIPMEDIKPRENVFTYEAWKALGRQVRKGEHGVRVITVINYDTEKEGDNGEKQKTAVKRLWNTTVFHVSQTDPIS